MDFTYRPRARTYKTIAAVCACLVITRWSGAVSAFYATIAVLICMQPTAAATAQACVSRLLGTVIGGAAGYAVASVAPVIPHYDVIGILLIPAVLFLLIWFCNWIGKNGTVVISGIVFLGIATNPAMAGGEALAFAVMRVLDTALGILLTLCANRFLFRRMEQREQAELSRTAEKEG